MSARILLVEDESIVGLDLRNRLTELGYTVTGVVASGAEAIRLSGADPPPDLILMDIGLRGAIDGVTAAERVRAQTDVPMVYLTACADGLTLQRATRTDPAGYIMKPVDTLHLHATIEMALHNDRLMKQVRTNARWLAATLAGIGDAVVVADAAGRLTLLNPAAERLTGWTQTEALGRPLSEVLSLADAHTCRPVETPPGAAACAIREADSQRRTLLRARDGRDVQVVERCSPMHDERGAAAGWVWTLRDIGEQVRLDAEQLAVCRLLRVLNTGIDGHGLMRQVLDYFKELTGCQALGIRLRRNGDYPYCATTGFPEAFVAQENSLRSGSPTAACLACLCGDVIEGRIEADLPYFTARGGFWVNSAADLTAAFVRPDRPAETRMACCEMGFESVALFPLRAAGETYGLLQCGDRRPNRFSPESVALIEKLADYVGCAVAHHLAVDALRESDAHLRVLLKEIHHRVKNNLQVISSLLNLQAGYVKDPGASEYFRECHHRVRSMALIHEHLYQAKNLAQIDFAEYARNLAHGLVMAYRPPPQAVALRLDVEPVALSVDVAVPCGLILNELISNSLRHAFPEGRTGTVAIALRLEAATRTYVLTVGDDGVGLPPGLDVQAAASLGLQLVTILAKQLGGILAVDRAAGTTFTLRFPMNAA